MALINQSNHRWLVINEHQIWRLLTDLFIDGIRIILLMKYKFHLKLTSDQLSGNTPIDLNQKKLPYMRN